MDLQMLGHACSLAELSCSRMDNPEKMFLDYRLLRLVVQAVGKGFIHLRIAQG